MAKKIDWFRKTTWTEADQADFEARLKRTRSNYNKAQYTRIQAFHLKNANPPVYAGALVLLERVLTEFPDQSQTALALLQKAACVQALNGMAAAVPFYRASLLAEEQYSRAGTRAWIDYPWQILLNRQVALYPEAMALLEKRSAEALFPIDKFQANAIKALIKKQLGDLSEAQTLARNALAAAGRTHSGFRSNPDVGLVTNIEPWIEAELLTLAEGG